MNPIDWDYNRIIIKWLYTYLNLLTQKVDSVLSICLVCSDIKLIDTCLPFRNEYCPNLWCKIQKLTIQYCCPHGPFKPQRPSLPMPHSIMTWLKTWLKPFLFTILLFLCLCAASSLCPDQSLCVSIPLLHCHSVPFRISRTASQSPCRLAVYRRKGQGKLSRSQPLRDGEMAGETGKSEQGRGGSLSGRKRI